MDTFKGYPVKYVDSLEEPSFRGRPIYFLNVNRRLWRALFATARTLRGRRRERARLRRDRQQWHEDGHNFVIGALPPPKFVNLVVKLPRRNGVLINLED